MLDKYFEKVIKKQLGVNYRQRKTDAQGVWKDLWCLGNIQVRQINMVLINMVLNWYKLVMQPQHDKDSYFIHL